MSLENINGIGPKSIKLLNNLGIYNMDDLVRNYPYRFDVIARRNIKDEKYYDEFISDGIVESSPVVNFFKGKMNRLSFRCNIQNKIVKVTIFNRAFMKNNIKVGSVITIIGKYNPKTEVITASNILLKDLSNGIEINPIYHLCKGITTKQMSNFINRALLDYDISNNIPSVIKDKYGFINEKEALSIIHNPKDENTLKTALKTLKYEELFTYMKKVKELKKKNEEHNSLYIKNIDEEKIKEFINSLPFELTIDQKKVINDMINDLKSDTKMN